MRLLNGVKEVLLELHHDPKWKQTKVLPLCLLPRPTVFFQIGLASKTEYPEWADEFVKYHIEYCSYEWCKMQTTSPVVYKNEDSYAYNKRLKEVIATGTEAVAAGLYNRLNMMARLDADPFFTGNAS